MRHGIPGPAATHGKMVRLLNGDENAAVRSIRINPCRENVEISDSKTLRYLNAAFRKAVREGYSSQRPYNCWVIVDVDLGTGEALEARVDSSTGARLKSGWGAMFGAAMSVPPALLEEGFSLLITDDRFLGDFIHYWIPLTSDCPVGMQKLLECYHSPR